MLKMAVSVVFILFWLVTKVNAGVDQAPVRISIVDQSFFSGGAAENDCVVIYSDNTYHAERRRQEQHTDLNSLVVSDSRMSKNDLSLLKNALGRLSVSNLAEYVPPVFPLAVSNFQSVIVEVKLSGAGHKFGYLEWPNKTKEGSPNTSPEETKRNWQASAVALRPLRDLAEELSRRKAGSSRAANLCGREHP